MNEPAGQVATVAEPPADSVENRRANYNRLVRQAKLTSILLEKIEFKVAPEAYGLNKSLLKRELNVTTDLMSFDSTDGSCVADIEWTVMMKFKKKNVVKCVASYLILYDAITGCSEETVKVFIDNVAKTATYAYFRGLYAHLDWSANLGSAPLPIVQFQPKV